MEASGDGSGKARSSLNSHFPPSSNPPNPCHTCVRMKIFLKRALGFVVNDWVAWLVLVTALAACAAVAVSLQPVVLVIAAGQTDQDEKKVVQLLIDTLAKERSGVRLTPLWTAGFAESAAALSSGKADLAVIRSDVNVGRGASSLVSLRKFYPVVFTSKGTKITKISDLRGKRIGVGGQGELNQILVRQILSHRGLQEQDYTLVPLKLGEQADYASQGKIDAFFSVSAGRTQANASFNDNIRKAWGEKFVVVALDDAAALALRIRGVETGEIVKGFFGSDPPKPDEATETITLSNRIVASEKVSPNAAVTLTRTLFALRDKRQLEVPEALAIAAPSREVPTLPVHPGTVQLLDGVYQDFLDRYINHMFIGLASLGVLGSAVTAISARRRRGQRERSVEDLHSLLGLSERISRQDDPVQAAQHLQEVDVIFQRTMIACAEGQVSSGALVAIQAAVNRCHRAAELRIAFDGKNAATASAPPS
jgi:TRAP transporter TAXI family solute receptor